MNPVHAMRCKKLMEHFSALCGVDCCLLDEEERRIAFSCGEGFCQHCGYTGTDTYTTHLYGCHEARRWGGKYIYYCPAGFIFISAALELPALGAVVAGPIVMGEEPDSLRMLSPEAAEMAAAMQAVTTAQVNHMCEVLSAAVGSVTQPGREFPGSVKAQEYMPDVQRARHYDSVYKAIDFTKRHYSEKFTLDDVAEHVGLSRTYLSSVFKKATGVGLFEYVNRYRVEVSKMLLVDTEMNMVEVAGECGFQDQSYFTRVFKKLVGVSPKRYRSFRGNIETKF